MSIKATASVRALRNDYAKLIARAQRGYSVTILRRGKPVARLIPAASLDTVDWTQSAALAMRPAPIEEEALQQVLSDNRGQY